MDDQIEVNDNHTAIREIRDLWDITRDTPTIIGSLIGYLRRSFELKLM